MARRCLLLPAWVAILAACGRADTQHAAAAPACFPGGELVAEVYGSVEGELDWRGAELECAGMPRPHGRGARLRFAGPAAAGSGASRLAFIIALPDLERGRTGKELPAGVTLMEENAGRFFSTPEQTACWADIEQQAPIDDEDAGGDGLRYRISGLLYCLSPLAEVNGNSSVSLRDLRFSGQLDWTESQ